MISKANTIKVGSVFKRAKRSVFACAIAMFAMQGGVNPSLAAEKQSAGKANPPKAEAKRSEASASGDNGDKAQTDVMVDGKKAKVLSFGAMDVEGKMRTPQLLFFLGRVKAELDSTSQLRRSFIKELKATSKEKGL